MMNAPAILLARSNSATGVKLVLQFGCDNNAETERDAGRNGNAEPFDFCHLVVGVKGAPPRIFAEHLRIHRDGATTWLSGTYGDFMRVLIDKRMDPTMTSGYCGAIQQSITGLEPFGNPRFLAVRKGVTIPKSPAELKASGNAEGGIFVLAADLRTERELLAAGGRVLDRVPRGESKPWIGLAEVAPDNTAVDLLRVGTLALPLAADDAQADMKLLRPLAEAYERLQAKAKNRALADLLRYEFETTSLLVSADRGVFSTLATCEYTPAQHLAKAATGALDTAAEAPPQQEKRTSRVATKVATAA
jgi:hypothetical protein